MTSRMLSVEKYLKSFVTKDKPNYTRIGSSECGVFGNKYIIPDNNIDEFYKVYKNHVFTNKKEEYLTEKQLEIGKILIDLDFRYKVDIEERQHTKSHVYDFIEMCIEGIHQIFKLEEQQIEFYIFEKDNVNLCEDKTKDGIHIIINILGDFAIKMVFRDYIVEHLADIWDGELPIINEWSDVVDEAVMKGNANWQMYGSRKPGNEQYKLKYIYTCNVIDNEINLNEIDIMKIDFNEYFPLFCARNTKNTHKLDIEEQYNEQYEKYKRIMTNKKNTLTKNRAAAESVCRNVEDIQTVDDIDYMLKEQFANNDIDYKVKETHNYTMRLPKEFWGPGSYDKWIRVGWALKNTHSKLFLTFLKFSSQSESFILEDCIDFWNSSVPQDNAGLTNRSIIYWLKNSDYNEYKKIYKNTLEFHIYNSFCCDAEYNVAQALSTMFKEEYVCANVKSEMWYQFKTNKWCLIDSGTTLRNKISTDLHSKYIKKFIEFQDKQEAVNNNIAIEENAFQNVPNTEELNQYENKIINSYKTTTEDNFDEYKKKINSMSATIKKLKQTTPKDKIMKECKELFYDQEFSASLDKNPYLLSCLNYVIDFKTNTYRKGKHDDYVTKSTNLNFQPITYYQEKCPHIINEIKEFFSQLFPNPEINSYMWEHLASVLRGTNENQTFNIYNGSGSNGKSKLIELMGLVLGDYKGTVPTSLITGKRSMIGSTSSEIFNLIGVRFAIMQEPSKGDKINEGIMKELTGGDPIQCRALFQNSITFIPQFSLGVCTNTMLEVQSNDDGTWRRLRKVDFESKFTDKPYNDPRFPKKLYPYQFKTDPKIDEKFKVWAPVLLSMLVDICFKTNGYVTDVEPVMSATNQYRKEQDLMLEFHNAVISPEPSENGYGVRQRDITNKFKDWFTKNYSSKQPPNGKELTKYFEDRYGPYPSQTGWLNISFRSEYTNEEHFS